VEVHNVQRCIQSGEYTEVLVPSRTDPKIVYTVLVTDVDEPEETLCECEGFLYRGRCAHQQIALDTICGWIDSGDEDENELQTNRQHTDRECPRCGGPTEWVMEAE
jgi:rRNA maturation protein Nop10